MSDIGEGLGTAVEGGWFARTVEPKSGAKEKHPHQPDNCLNCDTPLVGAYCHACGQPGHIHRSLGAVGHDLLHGALHFEGKFWRTLPMLIFRPGRLTRRYIEGARARFVSPMALFLFSVFLMFAVFQVLGISAPTDVGTDQTAREFQAGLDEAFAGDDEPQTEGIEAEAADTGATEDEATQTETSDSEGQRIVLDDSGDVAMRIKPTGIPFLDPFINGEIGQKWRDNPSLMIYKLQANAYKFSWLLIPLSIPFMWLLFFWKRRYRAYDHAIFVTYSISFITLLFVALSALAVAGMPHTMTVFAFLLIPPFHLYKQLRGAYSLSRFSAAWRLLALSLCIWVIMLLFLQILLALGAF